MTKQAKKKPGKRAKASKPFTDKVLAKLGKKPQSTSEIAKKLKLVDDHGEPTNYGKIKVRTACKQLIEAGHAVQESSYRFAKYRLAA